MVDSTTTLTGNTSIIFVGNSYTFGRVDPVMHYNAANVHDLTAPSNGGNFTNTTGSNPYEQHPWGGVPGIFKEFTDEAGLSYDVSISARNAATLQGHYLNSNPAGWDLRGNVASRAWDTVVLQDNSTQALPSGAGTITFAAGSSTATLTLTPIADTTQETDEGVGITLTADATHYRVGTTSTITGTILNDDPTPPVTNPALPTVTLTANPSAVPEDSGNALVYTFTRTGSADTALTINFTAFRDGATSPSVSTSGTSQDFVATNGSVYSFQSGNGAATTGSVSFTSNTGSIVIPVGQTTATITLVPKADTTVENDESIRLTLSSNANYNVGTTGSVSTTIVNDDFAAGTDTSLPNITLSLPTNAVYEDSHTPLTYTFTRSGSNTQALTVSFGVNGTATLASNDFAVSSSGPYTFANGGASDPNLTSFQTYATLLAQYVKTGGADAANNVPANPNANAAANVYLYETWARPNLVDGAVVANTDPTTGAITNTTTEAPTYYTSLEGMTADLRSAYEGLAHANPIFSGVAPVGAAFLAAVQNGTAIRDPYTTTPANGQVDLWWDDNLHASKYGSYLSALTLFGTITGLDPRALGSGDKAASDLGIDPATAAALQNVAAATLASVAGTSQPLPQAHWTAPGQVTELQNTTDGLLASQGAFTFSDTNKADVHTVSVTPVSSDHLGTLTATLHNDTTGDGTGGNVNWTYTVDDKAVEFLGAGQTRVEHFTVTLTDQNGGTVQRDIAVTINGSNDAPLVSGAVTGAVSEDGAPISLDALAKASDVDQGTNLTVVNLPQTLPPGVSYDAATHSFTLNPSDPAYQALAVDQKQIVTVTYAVSDGIADPVAASATFTITGTNDAPLVSGAVTGAASEDGAPVSIDALAKASDVDQGANLTVVNLPQTLPPGVSYDAATHSFTLNPSDPAYQALATDQKQIVTVTYAVSDGIADPVAASATFTINGTNDAPLVSGAVIGAASEGGAPITFDALAKASDVDQGTNLTVVNLPQTLPPGLTYEALTHNFVLNPSDPAYQALALDQKQTVTVTYAVSDGIADPVAASATFTIIGTNDAPVSVPDRNAVVQRASVTGNVLSNDGDIDTGDTLHVGQIGHGTPSTAVTAAGVQLVGDYGSLTIKADGSYSYAADKEGTLAAGTTGYDYFYYTVSDIHGGTATNILSFTVTGSGQGDAGNNTIIAATGSNTLSGGAGDDTVVLGFKLTDAAISYDAAGHVVLDGPNGAHDVLSGFEHYQFTDGTVNENTGSALVDDLFYYVHNKDVWSAHVDAEAHYNSFGWHEGRDPNADFSTTGYLAANPDVAQSGVNPLTQYDQIGWKQGRDPSASFDNELYLKNNPDVAAAGIDPLAHYLAYGQAEGRQAYAAIGKASDLNAHPGFDAEYYLLSNPDVAKAALAAGGNSFAFAYQHYETFGWHEGRNPDAVFDTKYYLGHNTDVAAAGVDPLAHYDQFGWKEGRDPSAAFHTNAYEQANPDVAVAHVDPLQHYLQFGALEGRHLV